MLFTFSDHLHGILVSKEISMFDKMFFCHSGTSVAKKQGKNNMMHLPQKKTEQVICKKSGLCELLLRYF